LDGTIRADHHTHPAANALFSVVKDGTCLLILVEGSAHAGLQTIGLFTMTALEAERERSLFFYKDAGKRSWFFFLKSLDNILRLRMLNQAVNFAEPTSNTDFFFDEDSLHI
jgi:hypothetical protein